MIKLVLYIVVALLLLSAFGVSLQHVVDSPTTQSNFAFLWHLILSGWDSLISFLTGEANNLWEKVF